MIKRQRIMDVASELFAEQGISATSVQQITDRCGISKGAFYLSFKTKDELILALIDHAIMQFMNGIDQSVTNTSEDAKLLYQFYYTTFDTFNQYASFTKLFIKEQSHTLNKALVSKIHYFNQLLDQTITNIVDRLYGPDIDAIKYDLIYMIKSLMRSYAEFLLMIDLPVDIDLLARSLVEKINLLAEHTKTPFITQELATLISYPLHHKITREQMIKLIQQQFSSIKEPVVRESLTLLEQELSSPSLGSALKHGLIKNIENHPETEWIAYLLANHFYNKK